MNVKSEMNFSHCTHATVKEENAVNNLILFSNTRFFFYVKQNQKKESVLTFLIIANVYYYFLHYALQVCNLNFYFMKSHVCDKKNCLIKSEISRTCA